MLGLLMDVGLFFLGGGTGAVVVRRVVVDYKRRWKEAHRLIEMQAQEIENLELINTELADRAQQVATIRERTYAARKQEMSELRKAIEKDWSRRARDIFNRNQREAA